jgi:hypothetical protein
MLMGHFEFLSYFSFLSVMMFFYESIVGDKKGIIQNVFSTFVRILIE